MNPKHWEFKIEADSELKYYNLLLETGDSIETITWYSPEIQVSLVRDLKQDKEPLVVRGTIVQKYFKDGRLFCSVRAITGSKTYCIKLSAGSTFKITKDLDGLQLVILSYLNTHSETKSYSAVLLDTTDIYLITISHRGAILVKEFMLSLNEPSSKSERIKLFTKIIRQYHPEKFILVDGACEATADCFRKTKKPYVSIPYFVSVPHLLNFKEIRDYFNLSELNEEYAAISVLKTKSNEEIRTDITAIINSITSKKLEKVLIFPTEITESLFKQLRLIGFVDECKKSKIPIRLMTSPVLQLWTTYGSLVSY